MKWFEHETPENFFVHPNDYYLLVKLNNGKMIRATRSNGYWFGMWRWLRDNEVKEWTYLV